MILKESKNLKKILRIILILAIIFFCVLLLPQVRNIIVNIAEKTLGRELRNHGKWMNFLFVFSVIAILCFILVLKKHVARDMLYKIINNRHKEKIVYLMLLFTVFILELIFFRSMIFNRDNIVGFMGDSRLSSLVMEHWYKVFCGQEVIRDFPIFYPVKNTLGYSDTFFLLSLPYSFLRVIGYQWMTAYQLTLIGTHFFGSLCLVWFLRKSLKLPFWTCIIGLIICNFSNSFFIKIGHTQFVTFSLVPLLFILLKNFYDCLSPNCKKKRIIYGILSIISFSGIILTSFYIGFFTVFFLLIMLIVITVYFFRNNILRINQILEAVKTYKNEILLYLIFGIIAFLPFFWIYMPVYNDMGARSWEKEVINYLPHWYDLFNVSTQNLIWSFPTNSVDDLQVGYPLITGILLIVTCTFYLKQYFNTFQTVKSTTFLITTGFSFAIAVISLFIIKFEILNISFSFWFLFYKLIPGASVIRRVARFNHFLSLPAGILISLFLSERIRFSNKISTKSLITCIILVLIIFLEHQNKGNMCNWTKSYMNNYLEKVSLPPDDCDSFFLVNNIHSSYIHHLDAWSIAYKLNIKTINGYSGQIPKNWLPMEEMETNKNYTDLSRWINEYNLNNVYLYDYINDNWIKYTEDMLGEFQSNTRIEHLE